MTVSLPPYGYMEGGRPTGLVYEVVNAVAIEAGYTSVNTIVPLARAVKSLEEGTSDLTLMFPNPAIEEVAMNLGPLLPMEAVVLGRAGVALRSFKDVRGKIVATVRGAQYDERISKKNGVIVYPTESYCQSLKMLVAKRVDFAAGPKLGLLHSARGMSIPKRALGKPLVLSVVQGSLFLSLKNATPEKRQRLTEAMARLRKNGTIDAFLEKYSL